MRVEIAGWESVGVRCPDMNVDLRRDGQIPPVTLLQMPNGTGKTTTLELLNATLSGVATNWSVDRVRSYRRSDDDNAEGRFKATLLVDRKPLTIELLLNFETGQSSYRTTSPGSGGVVSRWHVPPAMNRFLTPEFLSLFIFDGEFAGHLLDGDRAEADRVVDALCQIYMLDDISAFAHGYWERSARAHTTKTTSGLAKLERTRDETAQRLSDVREAYSKAEQRMAGLDKEMSVLREKVEARITSVATTKERHAQAEQDRTSARGRVEEESKSLLAAIRWPHAVHPALAAHLLELHDSLDRLRLPENSSAQFFEELLEEDDCICGRPMDDDAAREIRQRATRYLDEDDAGVINALKKDIEQYVMADDDEEGECGHDKIVRISGELTKAVREEKDAELQERVLMQQLIDAGDQELGAWQEDLREKEREYDRLVDLVAQIEGAGDVASSVQKEWSLSLLENRLKERNDQIAEIRGTVRLRKQTELIENMLRAATEKARGSIKEELLEVCNERLAMILANDPLRIDRIDRSIRLVGQEGASAGQTLSIGYTFLMSVLNRGQNDFPLVVDSPAGPIDEGVRRRIGRLLPTLCTQFLGFTINTERVGFVDALEEKVEETLFLTLFRKTPGTQRMMGGLPPGSYVETDNAVLVDDRDYFFQFDVKDEEEEEYAV